MIMDNDVMIEETNGNSNFDAIDVDNDLKKKVAKKLVAKQKERSAKYERLNRNEEYTFDDLFIEETYRTVDGNVRTIHTVTKIKGRPTKTIHFHDVRTICIKFGISGYKIHCKTGLLELLAAKKINDGVYSIKEAESKKPPTRKAIQCNFRLLNILFSDEFALRFSHIGDPADHKQLDTRVLNKDTFWDDIAVTFADPNAGTIISSIQFDHYAIKGMEIDCTKILDHDGDKLKQMYKNLVGYYKTAATNFTTIWYPFV